MSLYFASAPLCNRALGMQNGRIKNVQLSASSILNKKFLPTFARLSRAGWCSKHNRHQEWFKVDFRRPTMIRQIGTLGILKHNWWIRAFKLQYSQDGLHWIYYSQQRVILTLKISHIVFEWKLNLPFTCIFNFPVQFAKILRLTHVLSWYAYAV